MAQNQSLARPEDKADDEVKDWIESNPGEFTIFGNFVELTPENRSKFRFRFRILERCKQYKGAPDEYLETMLKTFPENMKWYFNVLQAVLITGVVGFVLSMAVLGVPNLIGWLQKPYAERILFSQWIAWVLPLGFALAPIILALMTNEGTETSWLSYIVQHRLRIIHNLMELKIEAYYIAKIIEIRQEEKKKQQESPKK
jgi:hypothetical protein